MQIMRRAVIIMTMLVGLASGSYYQGGGSSFSIVTKHELPYHHVGYYSGGNDGLTVEGPYNIQPNKFEPYHYPKYMFDYGVKDTHTGDVKTQWERRDGDYVKGAYSLKDSDGTVRVVEYNADGHTGFNANVKKIGHAYHPQIYHSAIDQGYLPHGHASSFMNLKQYH